MTVKELIKKLEKIKNKDLEVYGLGYDEMGVINDVVDDEIILMTVHGESRKQIISLLIGDYK